MEQEVKDNRDMADVIELPMSLGQDLFYSDREGSENKNFPIKYVIFK